MRLSSTFLALAALCFVSVSTSPSPRGLLDPLSLLGVDFSAANHYNAPIPPWGVGAHPGWYLGNHPELYPTLFCLGGLICTLLELLSPILHFHCPKPSPPGHPTPPPNDGYTPIFTGLKGATQAGDYLTFGLVDSVADCKSMCNSVAGCNFINTYHDVNGKGGSTQLTCSLFSGCHTAADATNTGGQTQPNGSINYITDSDGYCKK